MIRSYKIKSYVPEKSFLSGKDARFCRAAFEDCFVVDFHNEPSIIASCRGTKQIETSMADTAALLTLFSGKNEFLMLPCSLGTLLIYPAWPHLEIALAFLLKEEPEKVEKAYQNAKRYAFSTFFDTKEEYDKSPFEKLETKIHALDFYMRHFRRCYGTSLLHFFLQLFIILLCLITLCMIFSFFFSHICILICLTGLTGLIALILWFLCCYR